jgi:hypothetical protein
MAGRPGHGSLMRGPGEQANRSSPQCLQTRKRGPVVGLAARQYAAHLRAGLAFRTVTA